MTVKLSSTELPLESVTEIKKYGCIEYILGISSYMFCEIKFNVNELLYDFTTNLGKGQYSLLTELLVALPLLAVLFISINNNVVTMKNSAYWSTISFESYSVLITGATSLNFSTLK